MVICWEKEKKMTECIFKNNETQKCISCGQNLHKIGKDYIACRCMWLALRKMIDDGYLPGDPIKEYKTKVNIKEFKKSESENYD